MALQRERLVEIARELIKAGQVDEPFTDPSSNPIAALAERLHSIVDSLDPSDVEWADLAEQKREFYFFTIVGLLDEPGLIADAVTYKEDMSGRK